MNTEQEKHLSRLQQIIADLLEVKYRQGAAEHEASEPLLAMEEEVILNNIIEEQVDGLVYSLTLRKKKFGY